MTLEEQYQAASQAFYDNVGFDDGAGNVVQARAYKTACVRLMRMPTLVMHHAAGGQHQATFDPKMLQSERDRVLQWLAYNDSLAGANEPVQLSFEELRT